MQYLGRTCLRHESVVPTVAAVCHRTRARTRAEMRVRRSGDFAAQRHARRTLPGQEAGQRDGREQRKEGCEGWRALSGPALTGNVLALLHVGVEQAGGGRVEAVDGIRPLSARFGCP